jgi:predicted dehydrogenase
VLCEEGAVEWNFKAGKLLESRDRDVPLMVYRKDGSCGEEEIDPGDPFTHQWEYFLDCIEERRDIERATFQEGKTALELALASIESAKEGKAVSFNEIR